MIILSPMLRLRRGVIAAPDRHALLPVRDGERASRIAVGEMNTHLQETLRGVEVIRISGGRRASFASGRCSRVLQASNRSTIYSSFYPPLTALMTTARSPPPVGGRAR
jgi:ABC-type multidrug transport system fused ATPase/permease subunit